MNAVAITPLETRPLMTYSDKDGRWSIFHESELKGVIMRHGKQFLWTIPNERKGLPPTTAGRVNTRKAAEARILEHWGLEA